jgi:hypothetical protein
MHAEGVKKIKEELAEIFCAAILGLKELPDDSGKEPYDPVCLKKPDVPFTTEPKYQVLDVELKLLRLDLPFDKTKGSGRRIVVSAASLRPHHHRTRRAAPVGAVLRSHRVGRGERGCPGRGGRARAAGACLPGRRATDGRRPTRCVSRLRAGVGRRTDGD